MLLKKKGYLVEVTTKIISVNLCKALMQEHQYTFFPLILKHDHYQDLKFPPFKNLKRSCNKVSLQKVSNKKDHAGVNLLTSGDTDICVELSSLAPLAVSTGKELL